jgi:signal-transduction protein with cAMP-binding, CBS, and nucleotidyltransferase domain
MKTGFKVCDAMTRKPIVVSPNKSIEECCRAMTVENVGSLLIKDGEILTGIITDQDIVRKIIANGIDPKKAKVKEHMSVKLSTIHPDEDIFDALKLMSEANVKQLPVLDDKRMVGLLTQKDVLKIEPELFDLLVDKLQIREEENKPVGNDGVCEECGNYSQKLLARKGALVCLECGK